MMTKVIALGLGVHDPDGDVLLDELPPHDIATAIAAAAIAPATSVLT
jgi:hypothetical protein